MTDRYLLHSAPGVADGTTWNDAFLTLANAYAGSVAGDTIYVSNNHAESQASNLIAISPGTPTEPISVLCGDDSLEPPTTLATTATISSTDNSSLSMLGFSHVYGITFTAGDSITGDINIGTGTDPAGYWFDNCKLVIGGNSNVAKINCGHADNGADAFNCELVNTTVKFGHASQRIALAGKFLWKDTNNAIDTGVVSPSGLFEMQIDNKGTELTRIIGVDLSSLGSGDYIVDVDGGQGIMQFVNCRFGPDVSLATGNIQNAGGVTVEAVNCSSGNTNYSYYKKSYQGEIFDESTIVRTDGATDGVTPISRKLISSPNTHLYSPLILETIPYWNTIIGSSLTAKVNTVIDDDVFDPLNDGEAWLEIEYLGTSGFPQSVFSDDRVANIITAGTTQTSGTAEWTTVGMTSPYKQEFSVDFTPEMTGVVNARVMLAKLSTTFYVCPKLDISYS